VGETELYEREGWGVGGGVKQINLES